jgi:hypothetical protein
VIVVVDDLIGHGDVVEMSSCGVRIEAPSFIHTKLVGFLFPEGHPNFFCKNLEYRRSKTGSLRQMQTCVSKIGLLHARAAVEISIDSLPEIERHFPARTRRCLLHIVAMLRRPRTARFHWAGILRDLRGVETQSSRLAPRSARSAPAEMTFAKTLWRQH